MVVGVIHETSKGKDEDKNNDELDSYDNGVEEGRLTDTTHIKS